MAYSLSLRQPALASSTSSGTGAALEDRIEAQLALGADTPAQLALEAGTAALADMAAELQRQIADTGALPAHDGLDSFDDTTSEAGEEEALARQRDLDTASAHFLAAVDTGIMDADGLHWYSDETWRPAGINYAAAGQAPTGGAQP